MKEINIKKHITIDRISDSKNCTRIWELDFLRGVALILMVYFHTIYDLKEFYYYTVSYTDGLNFYIGKISAILFMLISGTSSSLSANNTKRGIKVLCIAMLITIITHLYDLDYGIKFGILHFLGVSMLLSPVFIKLNKYVLIALGIGILGIGNFITEINTSVNYLFPFGITDSSFASSDYYPLVPWLGVFLIGLSLGKLLYSDRRSLLPFGMNDNFIMIAGQHTLSIYLFHQPAIMIVLILLQLLN